VTVGTPLPQPAPFDGLVQCGEPCTLTNGSEASGLSYRSPIDGTIVRWRIYGGAIEKPSAGLQAAYRLRILTPSASGATNPLESKIFTGAGSSDTGMPTGNGLSTFPASLHVQAGQLIGIDLLNKYSDLAWYENPSMRTLVWDPAIEDGETRSAFEGEKVVLAFNADVQPPPSLSNLSRAKGSIAGGFPVTLTGSDFSGATAVLFGDVPAKFTVNSDAEIVAVVPPRSTPGKVAITVETAAGASPSATAKQFRYVACVVPFLDGNRLKTVKRRLRAAHCKVGHVKKLPGAKAKTGRVVKQKPRPASVWTPGTAVSITLKKHR
jgi:hypothetical protein